MTSQFVDLFVCGRIWPGDLCRHTASFRAARHETKYLVVKYEELVRKAPREFGRLLDFIGIHVCQQDVDRLIEHTSFAGMSRIHDAVSAQQGGVPVQREQMMRKGEIGDYGTLFGADALDALNEHFRVYLIYYGYEPA